MNDKMPVLFVGHGSPMSAIEDNEFTREWEKIAEHIPAPAAILSISAHWTTEGTELTGAAFPRQIYDMYGFPEELYRVKYEAPGDAALAARVKELLGGAALITDKWGVDHGSWSVLVKMYPDAHIPVVQMSVDLAASPEKQYAMGRALEPLRSSGVLIMGSGAIVHNLRTADWGKSDGFDWADDFDNFIRDAVKSGSHKLALEWEKFGHAAKLSVPTAEHLAPLFYVLGAAGDSQKAAVFNDSRIMGSISMTGYVIG